VLGGVPLRDAPGPVKAPGQQAWGFPAACWALAPRKAVNTHTNLVFSDRSFSDK